MSSQRSRAQRWLLVGGLLVILIVVGLIGREVWQQITYLQRLRATEMELRTQIQYEQERRQQLERLLQHVSSPDYPEEWARRYGGMVRPGEIPVIIPDSAEPTPTP